MPIRVLVVDDSALARKMISEALNSDPRIDVVAVASSAEAAWSRMQRFKPDVITLDAVMEPTDGVTFLRDYMAKQPTPTVLVSSMGQQGTRTSIDALSAGALSVVAKPTGWEGDAMRDLTRELRARVREASKTSPLRLQPAIARRPSLPAHNPSVARARHAASPQPAHRAPQLEQGAEVDRGPALRPHIIALGASTGGATALARIMPLFPLDTPPIVVVDHMPEGFTKEFAERINQLSPIFVTEAKDRMFLTRGQAVIAPGGAFHMEVIEARQGGIMVQLVEGPKNNGHRPSVNVLFRSLAKNFGRRAACGLLTGMGRDGAEGMLAMKRAGAWTIAQNEATSIVYGMPKAAYDLGAARAVLPLDMIPRRLVRGD